MNLKQCETLIYRLENKYQEELDSPDWNQSEIDELGGMLRRDVQEIMRVKKEVNDCLVHLYRKRDAL